MYEVFFKVFCLLKSSKRKIKINLLKVNGVAKQYTGNELFILWTFEHKNYIKNKILYLYERNVGKTVANA